MKYNIVALYVCIDNFSKIYEECEQKKLIGATKNRKREGQLSMSEKLLIVVLYHLEGFKNFKYYYKYAVEIKYKSLFKEVPCYNRFIQIMAIKITKGNVDDRTPVAELTKKLKGSIYADKGYIRAGLFKALYKRGLKLITGIKKIMKNYLIDLTDKKLLRKRFCIETIFGFLKNSMNIKHTRHQSSINFLINLVAALTAYSFTKGETKKLSISTSLIHS